MIYLVKFYASINAIVIGIVCDITGVVMRLNAISPKQISNEQIQVTVTISPFSFMIIGGVLLALGAIAYPEEPK